MNNKYIKPTARVRTQNNNSVLVCFCACTALCILFGTHNWVFSFLGLIIAVCVIVFFTPIVLPFFLFLVPIAGIFKLSPNAMSLLTVLQIIYIGYWLIVHKVYDVQITKTIFLMLYLIFISLFISAFNISNYIKLISKILFIWIAFHEINDNIYNDGGIEIFAFAYIFGNLWAIIISKMNSSFFNINAFIRQQVERFGAEEDVIRFSGLAGDPNYFVLGIIISMCLCVILLHRHKIKLFVFAVLSFVFFMALAASGSKSAMIMLCWPVALFLISNIKKRKYFLLLLSCVSILIVTYMIINGEIEIFSNTIRRFNNSSKDINTLTTGRTNIWKEYIKYFIDNPIETIFGNGASTYTLRVFSHSTKKVAVHNAYIDTIFQLGIIGTLLFVSIIYSSMSHIKRKHSILNYSIYVSIVIMYMFLNQLSDYEWPYHIILATIIYNSELQSIDQEDQIKNYNKYQSKYLLKYP